MKKIYNISVEREALRCTNEGKLSKLMHPESFGNKEKNKFITTSKIEQQIKICTPKCENISECYIKLEEITDIVLYELHQRNELLWADSKPCLEANKGLCSNVKIKFEFIKDGYEEIKNKYNNVPNSIEEAYKFIKNNMNKDIKELKSIYGNIEIKIENNELQIDNITLNSFDRCGISIKDLENLILEIFACLLNDFDFKKINHEFLLKCENVIKNELQHRSLEKINELKEDKILEISKEHMKIGYDERYRLKNYPKLLAEAAILIKDALSQGIDYKILNETTSFAQLNDNGHKEFIIEGNRTNRDSYIFPIITDDKLVSKNIMKDYGLSVPEAVLLNNNMNQEEKDELLEPFYNSKIVIKPRNTNMGTGITVFSNIPSKQQIDEAVKYAFKFDEDVLIEEYIKGMEYRFLVVDGKCVSVAHRRIASVVGNGKSTIKELIDEKNKEPWHALTGTPVKIEEPVKIYLASQGYTYNSIIEKDKRVFLRTNSNCSTGGESLDMTEKMPEYFKKISEQAAKAFDAKVCGVDLIIDDLNLKNYSIIEINDDPGYSINEWPYEGKGEKVGIAILKLLGYLN